MDDEDPFLMEGNHKEKQPWWNDGDKIGGLAASTLMIGFAIGVFIIIVAVCTKLAIWILG